MDVLIILDSSAGNVEINDTAALSAISEKMLHL